MKALLMHDDRDFNPGTAAPANEGDLIQDLELETLIGAMAAGDKRVAIVVKAALLHPLAEPDEILFRQHALADCVRQADEIRALYMLAVDSLTADRGTLGFGWSRDPESVLVGARRSLAPLIDKLVELRHFADEHAGEFQSKAFTRMFSMLREQLSDDYFALVKRELEAVDFKGGTLISARLGDGNKAVGNELRLTPQLSWRDRLAQIRRPPHSFDIHPRDEAGARALAGLRSVAVNEVANALAQSVEHIKSFFSMLAAELAFYVGCLNLRDRLEELEAPVCTPEPAPAGSPRLNATGLYDVSLSLRLGHKAVGNDIDGDGRNLLIVTGANQGGKSTFLRSLGAAQLMMQSGMNVGAESFTADVRDHVFTHYKREEDASMESGKLDEELVRMDGIADEITGRSLLLSNESFQSTNESEGSEIARQVVGALGEAGVKIVFVTHLFDFADAVRQQNRADVLFLRAPRSDDRERTYKLVASEPLPTSYGEDTYKAIFGETSIAPLQSPSRSGETR